VTEDLGAGLLAGAASGALAVAVTLLLRFAFPGREGPPPVGAVALLLAVGVGFGASAGLPGLLLAALLLAALTGAIAEVLRWPPVAAAPLAVPTALLVVAAAPDGVPAWASVVAGAGVVVTGGLLADVDRRWRERGLVPPLLAVTAGGVLLTVPDTEHAAVLAGAAAVLGLCGWPVPLASLGLPGAFVAAGTVAWVALQGGVGRPASVVGALACWGLLAVGPLVDRGTRTRRSSMLTPVVVHAAVVVAVARLAGRGTSVVVAAVLAAGFLAAGAGIWRRLAVDDRVG
jgi:hypothetical protein